MRRILNGNDLTRLPLFILLGVFLIALSAAGRAAPKNLCDHAAYLVAGDVPAHVLLAITRVETGRSLDGVFQPAPWAVNAAGESAWFKTSQKAAAFVRQKLRNGHRNVDIGCFQLNYRWHGDAFASVEEMFDPIKNGDYAARFLKQLYQEFGTWDKAVSAYHSRTPKYAEAYLAKYRQVVAELPTDPSNVSPPVLAQLAAPKQGRVPLVARGRDRPVLGSLFGVRRKTSKTYRAGSLYQ